MNPWTLILVAAACTYAVRVAPFVIFRGERTIPPRMVRFLDLMSFGILGGLVADNLWISELGLEEAGIRTGFTLAAFGLAFWSKSPNVIFYSLFGAFLFFKWVIHV